MTIGEKVKSRREAANLTQEQLAEKVGVSRSMIAQIERGTKALSVGLADSMATVFGCTLDELLHGECA